MIAIRVGWPRARYPSKNRNPSGVCASPKSRDTQPRTSRRQTWSRPPIPAGWRAGNRQDEVGRRVRASGGGCPSQSARIHLVAVVYRQCLPFHLIHFCIHYGAGGNASLDVSKAPKTLRLVQLSLHFEGTGRSSQVSDVTQGFRAGAVIPSIKKKCAVGNLARIKTTGGQLFLLSSCSNLVYAPAFPWKELSSNSSRFAAPR
jgi:hypothetical protein